MRAVEKSLTKSLKVLSLKQQQSGKPLSFCAKIFSFLFCSLHKLMKNEKYFKRNESEC
jgi:hypothetical protein